MHNLCNKKYNRNKYKKYMIKKLQIREIEKL